MAKDRAKISQSPRNGGGRGGSEFNELKLKSKLHLWTKLEQIGNLTYLLGRWPNLE